MERLVGDLVALVEQVARGERARGPGDDHLGVALGARRPRAGSV
jgi:hypothetical protein